MVIYHQNIEGCCNKPEEFVDIDVVVVIMVYFMILPVCRVNSIEV